MHLSWLGQTCLRLQTKHLDEDVVTIFDPYKPAKGDFPRSFSPNIALFSNGQDGSVTLSQNPFIMDTLGEGEIKEIMITAFPSANHSIIYKINAEQISLVHLGRLHKKPDLAELEKLGSIDILIVPVGGGANYLDPESAAELVTALEPRVVIPVAYHADTDPSARPLSDFIKEMGLKAELTDKKIIIKKRDLPTEEMKLYVLEKNI